MSAPAGLAPLFRELGDLKRIRSAAAPGSIAERRFREAWAALAAGEGTGAVMERVTAACLVAARLGDLDVPRLRALGLSGAETARVLSDAFDAVADGLDPALRARLRPALQAEGGAGPTLPFVDALCRQPRAGVTCPGKPRILLEPSENHAEHCLVTAVYGVILSPFYGAEPETVFLAALAHHLHNAAMPDSGFTGEMLLAADLEPVVARAAEAALAEMPAELRRRTTSARRILAETDTPEAKAFHAADAADRVLQIDQHLKAASLTMKVVLDDMALVHEGPVKPFQDAALAAMGIP